MTILPYRDIELSGPKGGFIGPSRDKLKIIGNKVTPKINDDFKKLPKRVEKINILGDDFKVIEIAVPPIGTLTLEKINVKNIGSIKKLYALSKNAKEFNCFYTLYNQNFKKSALKGGIPNVSRFSIDAFLTLILAIREINTLTPQALNIDFLKIDNIVQLEEEFIKHKKYLFFSKQDQWQDFVRIASIKFGNVIIRDHKDSLYDFIRLNFSLDEIKQLVKKHLPTIQGSNLDRISYIILAGHFNFLAGYFNFAEVIEKFKIYFKNQDFLKSFEIDFDKINIKNNSSIQNFFFNINNINAYKILSKIQERLNSYHRQTINSNKIIFNSFLDFSTILSKNNTDFKTLEPVLIRINTYSDVNVLLNALYGIISEFNIYNVIKQCKEISGAKMIYFDESDQIAIIKITKYGAMREIGSTAWCIQNSEVRYNEYKKNVNMFYIFIDAKSKDKNMSKIGFTIYPNGAVKESCDFKNSRVRLNNDFYKKYGKYMKGLLFRNAKTSSYSF
jgi:hypothetical protein